jgi:predicted DNA-binding transcriptional regulator AlpA
MSEGRPYPLPRTYRAKAVQELFGFSHATLYAQIAKGRFPRPNIQIGERAVGWTEDVLQAEQARRIAERAAVEAAS